MTTVSPRHVTSFSQPPIKPIYSSHRPEVTHVFHHLIFYDEAFRGAWTLVSVPSLASSRAFWEERSFQLDALVGSTGIHQEGEEVVSKNDAREDGQPFSFDAGALAAGFAAGRPLSGMSFGIVCDMGTTFFCCFAPGRGQAGAAPVLRRCERARLSMNEAHLDQLSVLQNVFIYREAKEQAWLYTVKGRFLYHFRLRQSVAIYQS
jgi:hypothetical protein